LIGHDSFVHNCSLSDRLSQERFPKTDSHFIRVEEAAAIYLYVLVVEK
jgi:hypothetical protein